MIENGGYWNQCVQYAATWAKPITEAVLKAAAKLCVSKALEKCKKRKEEEEAREQASKAHRDAIREFLDCLDIATLDYSVRTGLIATDMENPHDLSAAVELLSELRAETPVGEDEVFNVIHPKINAHQLIFGGVSATALAKISHGFVGDAPDLRVDMDYYDIMPLRFYSIGSEEEMREAKLHEKVRMRGRDYTTDELRWFPPIWNTGIKDLGTKAKRRNQIRPDGMYSNRQPRTMHLLITKMPNILSAERVDPAGRRFCLITFDGSRAIATRAFALLFEPERLELLTTINNIIDGVDLFQIVLDVGFEQLPDDAGSGHSPKTITLATGLEQPYHVVRSVDMGAIKEAYDIASSRLTPEDIGPIDGPGHHN